MSYYTTPYVEAPTMNSWQSYVPAIIAGAAVGVVTTFAVSSVTPSALYSPSVTTVARSQQIALPPQLSAAVSQPLVGVQPQSSLGDTAVETVSATTPSSTSPLLWAAVPLIAVAGAVWSFAKTSTSNMSEALKSSGAALEQNLNLLKLQEKAARARLEAEQQGFFDFFCHINPGKATAALVAATPFLAPAAALANAGPVPTSVTPDLLAGVGAGVSLVAFGQYLYDKAGGHAHGPPEPAHPIDPAAQPYPEGPDGEALKAVFEEPYDFWRQSLARYLGYSNELGEAFRPLVGDFLANSTYIVAISYVLADALDKAGRASERARELAAAAVFLQLDEGLHGQLKNEDLQAALKSFNVPLSTAEVEEFLKRADVRKDNNIDFDEFYLALKRKDPAVLKFLDSGAKSLSEEAARPWRRAMVDGVNLAEAKSAVAGLDALLWQLTASVAMPGFTINRIVALTGAICYGWKTALAGVVDPVALDILNYIPTIIGLLSITVIVHPLDTLADELFNVSIRKYVFNQVKADTAGQLTEEMMIQKLRTRGDGNPLPDDWVRRLFKDVDTDKDGFVSLTEWRRNGIGAYERYVESLKTPW